MCRGVDGPCQWCDEDFTDLRYDCLRSACHAFFQRQPFNDAEATYVWSGANQPGFFQVTVKGEAPRISSGFELKQDITFAGGLTVEVMGWTGPLIEPPETVPYSVTGRFNGTFLKEVVVIGSNKIEVVPVKEVPFTTDEEFTKVFSPA
jgi:hypothetical protein